MRLIARLRSFLSALLGRRRLERDMEREWQFHRDARIDTLTAGGLSRAEAERQARVEFGDPLRWKEQGREAHGLRWVHDVGADVRYALRQLRRSPTFTIVALTSLAIGIGANTAIFSVLYAAVLRPLPVRAPQQIVTFDVIQDGVDPSNELSYPSYRALAGASSKSLTGLAATGGTRRMRLKTENASASVPVLGMPVSSNYFAVLEPALVLGRGLAPGSDRGSTVPDAPAEIVIGENLWTRLSNRAPAIVGSTVTLNGVRFTVVGVTSRRFFGVETGGAPDLWFPAEHFGRVEPQAAAMGFLTDDSIEWLLAFGRLTRGATREAAAAELNAVYRARMAGRAATLEDVNANTRTALATRRIALEPGWAGWGVVSRQFARPLTLLMAMVAVVLLTACANVANLVLTRASARRKEIAMRLAIGAGRGRLLRQLLTESLLLALLGGALGIVLAPLLIGILLRYAPDPDMVLDASLDWRVLSFTLIVSVVAGLLFGLAPAVRATRDDLVSAIRNAPAPGSIRRYGLNDTLVVVQVALSLLLVMGAGLFARTLVNLRSLDIGFSPAQVMVFSLDMPSAYDDRPLQPIYREVLDTLKAIPGVDAATLSMFGMLSGSNTRNRIDVPGFTPPAGVVPTAGVVLVAPAFFTTYNIAARRGRDLDAVAGARPVAVISQLMADQFFAGDAIGRHFTQRGWTDFEVVGVVADPKYRTIRETPSPMFYAPLFLEPPHPFMKTARLAARFAFRSRTMTSEQMRATIARLVRNIDPELQAVDVRPMAEVVNVRLAQERLVATLATGFGLLGLLLAATGLYGVMSYSVARRTRDIGVRIALGARRADVFRMILGRSFLRIAIGIVVGTALAVAALPVARSLLFGLEPTDPLTFAGAVTILLAAGGLAAWVPARRASRTDPLVALRCE